MSDPFDDLDRITLEIIGDSVTYRDGGAMPGRVIRAFADQGDGQMAAGIGAVVSATSIEVRVSDVPSPSKADRIVLPRRPGEVFKPVDIQRSRSGSLWMIRLGKDF